MKGCYVLLPTHNYEIGVVKFGETGYYKTDFGTGFTQEDVDHFNFNLGVSKAEAEAMHICSMNSKLKTYEKWEEHYNNILPTITSHMN